MVAGELYSASDPELVAACRNARRLCRAYNGEGKGDIAITRR